MVQNYRYLNELLFASFSDIVENIGMKKIFTKMDLR